MNHDWLDREAYPFASHTFALDVGRMHYVDEGEGEPVVMVHGNPQKACWVLPRQILGATAWLRALWAKRALLAEKPALIVWGMKDIAFREKELNIWVKTLPHAQVVRLDDVGHYVQEEAVDELGRTVALFLKV